MKEEVWSDLRREIEEDAKKLYAGEPTIYAQRLESLSQDIPINVIQEATAMCQSIRDSRAAGQEI